MPQPSRTSREYPFIYTALCALCFAVTLYVTGSGALVGWAAAWASVGTLAASLAGLALCIRPWRIGARRILDTVGVLGLLAALAATVAASAWVLAALILAAAAVNAARMRTRAAVTLPRRET